MATVTSTPLISTEEYIARFVEGGEKPMCEYIDGELRTKPIQGRYPGPGDPVFLCVEIKSPDDRIGKLFSKCEEYHAWGVPHCLIIDPERKVAWEYAPDDPEPRKADTALNAGPIQMTLAEVFRRV